MEKNNNLLSFISRNRGKTAAVIGIGISNRPLISFLLKCGIGVVARDRKNIAEIEGAAMLAENGVRLICGEDYLSDLNEDIIFRTPGMRPDVPALLAAKARGARITSEIELLFDLCPCPILAVTGSDGKTTTTTLTALLLRKAGHRVFLGGNIGTPLIGEVENKIGRAHV